MAGPDPRDERRALRRSIALTAVLGALGLGWGLAVGSQMIVLDGAYAAIGLVVSWLLLLASRLVDRGPTRRYPYGREAMTPLVVGLQGFVLLATLGYAAVDATGTVLAGGVTIAAGWALVYAVVTTLGSVWAWWWLRRAAPNSDLVAAEATAWGASVVLGVAMILGFAAMTVLPRTGLASVAPYVDPAMVLVSVGVLLPAPLRMVRATFVELLEGAPPGHVQAPIRAILDGVVATYRLDAPELRMTKIGPKLYVEIDAYAAGDVTIATEEEIRQRLDRELDQLPYDVWLNLELHPHPDPDRDPAPDPDLDARPVAP
jgi:predicted Co/Zn/Cd cation transporter (cation efflux family)